MQIEAVCADGLGRILLFQETPPRVEFMDPKAPKMIASIELAVEGCGEIAERGPIRRGRGEKKRAALIEFGPPDSRGRGAYFVAVHWRMASAG